MKKNRLLIGVNIALGLIALVSAARQYLQKGKNEIIGSVSTVSSDEKSSDSSQFESNVTEASTVSEP